MAVGSAQVAVTSTAQVIASIPAGSATGPAGAVMILPDTAADVYIGGVGVTSSNGLKVIHATTPVLLPPIPLFAGDVLYAVTASTATIGVLQT